MKGARWDDEQSTYKMYLLCPNLGKAMAAALLRLEIEVDARELDAALQAPRVGWWP